jgi:hypothetical protein
MHLTIKIINGTEHDLEVMIINDILKKIEFLT